MGGGSFFPSPPFLLQEHWKAKLLMITKFIWSVWAGVCQRTSNNIRSLGRHWQREKEQLRSSTLHENELCSTEAQEPGFFMFRIGLVCLLLTCGFHVIYKCCDHEFMWYNTITSTLQGPKILCGKQQDDIQFILFHNHSWALWPQSGVAIRENFILIMVNEVLSALHWYIVNMFN